MGVFPSKRKKCDSERGGLDKKARAGQIPEYTGISAPYEEPEDPEIVVETDKENTEESVETIISYLQTNGIVKT